MIERLMTSKTTSPQKMLTMLPNRLEDQYCFLTPAAIACLGFKGSEPYGI